MRILGIDPGFDRTGFGVIDQVGSTPTWVHHACLQTKAGTDFGLRLKQLHAETVHIIETFKPQCVAVEQLFFQTNVKTAIKVGMARGVIVLSIAEAGLPLVELTPGQVKQGIAGYGAADKQQVGEMVKRFLKLSAIPTPDDAADALAIAIVGGLMARNPRR